MSENPDPTILEEHLPFAVTPGQMRAMAENQARHFGLTADDAGQTPAPPGRDAETTLAGFRRLVQPQFAAADPGAEPIAIDREIAKHKATIDGLSDLSKRYMRTLSDAIAWILRLDAQNAELKAEAVLLRAHSEGVEKWAMSYAAARDARIAELDTELALVRAATAAPASAPKQAHNAFRDFPTDRRRPGA